MEELIEDLLKNKPAEVESEETFDMGEDILVYLEKGDEDEHMTNQHVIGMSSLFRGFATNVWKGVNFASRNYRQLNEILMRHCVLCCKTCWDNRNEEYHNKMKQR